MIAVPLFSLGTPSDSSAQTLPWGYRVELPNHADEPVCANTGHRIVAVRSYGSAEEDTPAYVAAREELVRVRIRQMNWKLIQQAQLSGGPPLELKVECDANGEIKVYESLSDGETDGSWRAAAFDLFRLPNGLMPMGADAIKVLIFRDQQGSSGGSTVVSPETVKSSSDDVVSGDPDESNRYRVITQGAVASQGHNDPWDDYTAMHELLHAMGAVAGRDGAFGNDPAPFADITGHCNDGMDVMCYGGPTTPYTVTRCPESEGYGTPDGIPIDCGYDTFFDAAPEPGEWLDRHWNVGGPENPYLYRPPEWAVMRSKVTSKIDDVHCVSASECVAVGVQVSESQTKRPLVARWDGSGWSRETAPLPSGAADGRLTGVSCSSASSCTAVGVRSDLANSTVNDRAFALAWDGSSWSAQSMPVPSGSKYHADLEVSCYPSGCIAVGSHEVSVTGGSARKSLGFKWNGTTWTLLTLPAPTGATSNGLSDIDCPSAFACRAIGWYTSSGQRHVMLMHHQLGSWTAQTGPAVSGASWNEATQISCGAGTCVAVGEWFDSALEIRKPFVIRGPFASGGAWSVDAVTVPSGATRSGLSGVSCPSTSCVAVGSYVNPAGVEVPFAQTWNGSSWSSSSVGTAAATTASDLDDVSCTSASACLAVGTGAFSSGDFFVASELDGGSWSAAGNGLFETEATGVSCTGPTACVSLRSSDAGPTARTWNGDRWAPMPALPAVAGSSLEALSCSASDACTAVGSKNSEDDVLVERWNGSQWAVQSAPTPSGSTEAVLQDVSCASSTACVAVGRHRDGSGTQLPLIESWNGSGWTIESVPAPSGATSSRLSGVDCFSASACVAVGSYESASGERYYAVKWDGTTWTLVALPSSAAPTRLTDVFCDGATQCIMVGSKVESGARKPLALWWVVGIFNQDSPALPPGASSAELLDVSRVGGVTAVGSYVDASGARKTYTLLRRNGASSWTIPPSPNAPAQTTSELTELACSSGGECVAAGKSTGAGLSQPLFEVYR
ncbi:MAG TPA: hypothetical protein VHF90_08725 [Thermoleophilaceae bacterium]|nr:hypothetical protein [Thermoleophilaceae bacterium]